jgi:ethanolamine utilization cobalamin adenosyltransferase
MTEELYNLLQSIRERASLINSIACSEVGDDELEQVSRLAEDIETDIARLIDPDDGREDPNC